MAKKRVMTSEHKAAIAAGRSEGAAVKRYLETIGRRGKPGRRVSREELQARLDETKHAIPEEDNLLARLDMIQKQIDLEGRLSDAADDDDSEEAEAAFISVAKDYAERKGISYTAFRKMGVPAAVLKKAGIPRTRSA